MANIDKACDADLTEVHTFLKQCVPFDILPAELLNMAVNAIKIQYYRQGSADAQLDYEKPQLYIVRTGAFEIRNTEGEMQDRIDGQGYFGYPSLLTGEAITNQMVVLEDGLLYLLDEGTFQALRSSNRSFDRFFNKVHAKRLRQAVHSRQKDHRLTQRVKHLIQPDVFTINAADNIQIAALKMKEHRVSSLLVVDGEHLQGIITDRDLRNRVLAKGLDGRAIVSDIMTCSPVTVTASSFVYEAMLLMSSQNIHHLPVIQGDVPNEGKLVGIVTSSDILRAQKSDPVLLIGEIGRQKDVQGLVKTSRDIPVLMRNLIQNDARAEETGRIITAMVDALTKQLLNQAEAKLGTPPVSYTWLALGSQGREEINAHSDQDNALLLSDDLTEDHAEYFEKLSEYVCEGLSQCGYPLCPGDVMAVNPRWRQPLSKWKQYFKQWIEEPTPQSLMHASIFFDFRYVAGNTQLASELQHTVLSASKNNQIFLACLAQNALNFTPPLGFFKHFVLERDGEENKVLDLKHRGVVPIVDVARVYSLADGLAASNTQDRLRQMSKMKHHSLKDCRNLSDSLEFIAHLRLLNQDKQLSSSQSASHYLQPKDVSGLTRHQLRDAFELVNKSQQTLRARFTRGVL